MKAFLMYKDLDFDRDQKLPWNAQALTQDLELNTLFEAMALDDEFLLQVARTAVLSGVNDLDTIRYRQAILKDCLKNPGIVRDIHALAVESIEKEKKSYFGIFNRYPSSILSNAIKALQMFVVMLKKLRAIADKHADKFESHGFTALFAMLRQELDDEYFATVQSHLKELEFRNGVLMSARVGTGNKGIDYVLRKPHYKRQSWFSRIVVAMAPGSLLRTPAAQRRGWVRWIFGNRQEILIYCVHPRDEGGARALAELKGRGINLVANAVAQSAQHILGFFDLLRTELAFYVGCLNLHEQLTGKGEPICFPEPFPAGERRHAFDGLYDACLSLSLERRVVGNAVDGDGKDLFVITGANQGGKSTFLRSIGLSQLMMQCGMFVPARAFRSNVCNGLFTHYKREEDQAMESGKLDEELSRMDDIVEHVGRDSLVLFNESFSATNEREGSEIGRQITSALLEKGIKVFFVTHQYAFAHGFFARGMANAAFLCAERQPDGRRTFRVIEGAPLKTSFGEDLYHRIFETGRLATGKDQPMIQADVR